MLSMASRPSESLASPTVLPQTARDADGSLPLAPVAVVQRTAEASPEPAASANHADEPEVQRGWFDSISSEVRSLGAPSFSQVSSAASTVGSGISSLFHSGNGSKPSEGDMDELAGKLYDKIRARLKSELLVDRERAGFLTDLR